MESRPARPSARDPSSRRGGAHQSYQSCARHPRFEQSARRPRERAVVERNDSDLRSPGGTEVSKLRKDSVYRRGSAQARHVPRREPALRSCPPREIADQRRAQHSFDLAGRTDPSVSALEEHRQHESEEQSQRKAQAGSALEPHRQRAAASFVHSDHLDTARLQGLQELEPSVDTPVVRRGGLLPTDERLCHNTAIQVAAERHEGVRIGLHQRSRAAPGRQRH